MKGQGVSTPTQALSRPRASPAASLLLGSLTYPISLFKKGSPLAQESLCGLLLSAVKRLRDPAQAHCGASWPSTSYLPACTARPGCGGITEWLPEQVAQIPGSVWLRVPLGQAPAPLWASVSHFRICEGWSKNFQDPF